MILIALLVLTLPQLRTRANPIIRMDFFSEIYFENDASHIEWTSNAVFGLTDGEYQKWVNMNRKLLANSKMVIAQ
ncbi:MAG TPA: hypothetical protein PLI65_01175 [Bacteroidales bacterium]|nr:hypothetical protein [Bacteroidales bacterium]HPR58533.1 hypothetical protein [Bacteroidales bacterium]HRW97114.1 hypothetical protein [Bacteroidales bacterium]